MPATTANTPTPDAGPTSTPATLVDRDGADPRGRNAARRRRGRGRFAVLAIVLLLLLVVAVKGPTSPWLIAALLVGFVGVLVLLARPGHWVLRTCAGVFALVLGMATGVAAVNDHYGYYRSWSSIYTDLSGSQNLNLQGGTLRVGGTLVRTGSLRQIVIRGLHSHIDRNGLIYLPPQYLDPRHRRMSFPVVELLHGSPGQPSAWPNILQVVTIIDLLIARHLMGPVVLVMPAINGSNGYQDCVNGKAGADETYLATDVPSYLKAHYRVSHNAAEWGLGGYSSGGFCAANLALRHRGSFGAAGIMDGYYRAGDGFAGSALGRDPAAEAANSPLDVARRLPAGTAPMPAFWVSAGTRRSADYAEAQAFVAAMRGLQQVTFVVEPGAGHNAYAWSAVLPRMLAWMWLQLARPELRTAFPVVGPPSTVEVNPVVPPHSRHTKHTKHPKHPKHPKPHRSRHIPTPSHGSTPSSHPSRP